MLILSRKVGESIIIAGRITVKIVRVEGDVVKVGIQAPSDVPVHREEVYREIQTNNREALTSGRPAIPKLRPETASSARTKARPCECHSRTLNTEPNPQTINRK